MNAQKELNKSFLKITFYTLMFINLEIKIKFEDQ
jgi:hypothetical protein